MLRMKRNRRIEKCRGIKRPGQRKSRGQVKNLPERVKPWWVCGAFLASAIRFALPVLAGILLSGILLIPSAAALFGGSGEGGRGTAAGGIAGLFTDPAMWKPQFLILRLCYTPYGIGLSAFAGVALLGRAIGKSRLRENCCPSFCWYSFVFPCSAIC